MTKFPVWQSSICEGCDQPQDPESKGAGEPFYKLDCADPFCDYRGCHECMPNGRGTRCISCADPEHRGIALP